jgi:hypothetical protein
MSDILAAFGTFGGVVESVKKTAENAAAGYRNVTQTLGGVVVNSPVSGSSSPTLLSQDTGIQDKVPGDLDQALAWAKGNWGILAGGALVIFGLVWAVKRWF